MDRVTRLRRVALLCVHFLRNSAYYRAGWSEGNTLAVDEFSVTIQGNFIDFVDLGGFVFQYSNVEERFTASGIEFMGNYKFTQKLAINANATYTKIGEDLNLRIPELKANVRLDYQVCLTTFVSLAYQYNDDRRDSVFNNDTFMNDDVTLKSYSLLDFYVSHSFKNNKMKLFANITNLLNESFVELFGYSTRGRNINLGVTIRL